MENGLVPWGNRGTPDAFLRKYRGGSRSQFIASLTGQVAPKMAGIACRTRPEGARVAQENLRPLMNLEGVSCKPFGEKRA